MPKDPTPPQKSTPVETQALAPTPTDAFVNVPLEDVTAPVTAIDQAGETARDWQDGMTTRQAHAIYEDAYHENRKFSFVRDITDARAANEVKAYTPPPIPEGVQKQTDLEMEAGRQAVAKHAEQMQRYPRPKPPENETMVPVFRPADYVPDPKKGQGLVASASARNVAL